VRENVGRRAGGKESGVKSTRDRAAHAVRRAAGRSSAAARCYCAGDGAILALETLRLALAHRPPGAWRGCRRKKEGISCASQRIGRLHWRSEECGASASAREIKAEKSGIRRGMPLHRHLFSAAWRARRYQASGENGVKIRTEEWNGRRMLLKRKRTEENQRCGWLLRALSCEGYRNGVACSILFRKQRRRSLLLRCSKRSRCWKEAGLPQACAAMQYHENQLPVASKIAWRRQW